MKRQRLNPKRRQQQRERAREPLSPSDLQARDAVEWLPVPVRVLGHAGPFVVGVARSAPLALRAEWLEAGGVR